MPIVSAELQLRSTIVEIIKRTAMGCPGCVHRARIRLATGDPCYAYSYRLARYGRIDSRRGPACGRSPCRSRTSCTHQASVARDTPSPGLHSGHQRSNCRSWHPRWSNFGPLQNLQGTSCEGRVCWTYGCGWYSELVLYGVPCRGLLRRMSMAHLQFGSSSRHAQRSSQPGSRARLSLRRLELDQCCEGSTTIDACQRSRGNTERRCRQNYAQRRTRKELRSTQAPSSFFGVPLH